MGTRVLVIDNYDSFVYNLVQELGELGAEPVVHRNDAIDIDGIRAASPDAILISPGPGRPESAGMSMEVVAELAGEVPDPRGLPRPAGHRPGLRGQVVAAPTLMHGKTSSVHHDGQGVFAGLPDPFVATRYHSLVVEPDSVPDVLEVTATHRRGGHHGPAPPHPGGRGRPVPPRVVPHPERSGPALQLPGLHRRTLSPRGSVVRRARTLS